MDEQTSAARTSVCVRVITVKNNVLPKHLERLPVDVEDLVAIFQPDRYVRQLIRGLG
jgi:hypothetical protein